MIKKNLFTILFSIVILYLSLSGQDNFSDVKLFTIPYFDKIAHFGMYFILMTIVLIENRKNINSPVQILKAAVFPFLYGIIMEILQSFTATRSASFFDILADSGGIILSVILWQIIFPSGREKAKL
jgi:VanZ family protein